MDVTPLVEQHVQLLGVIQNLWVAFIILVFLELLFMAVMFGLAAWSVQTVNKRILLLEDEWRELVKILAHNEMERIKQNESQSV